MSAENPADVIEQAAKVIWDADNADMPQEWRDSAWDDMGGSEPTLERVEYVLAVRALAAAGLLADPADRDVKARLIAHRNVLRRMDRAEAEVARLNDELIHVREVAELAEKDRRTYHRDALRAEAEVAELRATIDRVRAIHEPIDALMNPGPRERIVKVCTGCGTDDGNWQHWPCPTVRALDGAGEQ